MRSEHAGEGLPPKARFRDLSGDGIELQIFADRVVQGDLTVYLDRVGEVLIRPGPGRSPDPCDLVINISDQESLVISMSLQDAWAAQRLIKGSGGAPSARTRGAPPRGADAPSSSVQWEEIWHSSRKQDPAAQGEVTLGADAAPSSVQWEEIWRSPPEPDASVEPEANAKADAPPSSAPLEEIWRPPSEPDSPVKPVASTDHQPSLSARLEELRRSARQSDPAARPETPSDVHAPTLPPMRKKVRRSRKERAAAKPEAASGVRAPSDLRSGMIVGGPRQDSIPPKSPILQPSPRPLPVEKRPTRRRSRSRVRLIVLAGVLVVLVAIAAIADAYRQAYEISRSVRQSVLLLEAARSTVARGEVPAGQLMNSVGSIASRTQLSVKDARFTFGVVGRLPFFGRPVSAVRLAADAADEEAQAARIMRSVLIGLLGNNVTTGGTPARNSPVYRAGRVDLRLVAGIVPELSGLLLHLEAADADIRKIRSFPFMRFAGDLRARALAQSAGLIKLTEHAIASARLLPSFFGAGGARSYLLVLQDFAALGPTEGTVVAYGTLSMVDGALSLSDVHEGQDGPLAGRLVVAKSNSTSFEKQARAWSEAFRGATGHRIDGVIGVDPFAIAALLEGQPPTQLVPYPGKISSQNVVSVIERDIHQLTPAGQRALAVAILAEAIRVLKQPPDLLRLLKQISGAAANLHIELWASSARQEGLIREIGWSGG